MESPTVVLLVVFAALTSAVVGLLLTSSRHGREDGPAHTSDRRASRSPRPAPQGQVRVRELSPAHRRRFALQWQRVQEGAVARPDTAVDGAQALVTEVMRERGYPVDEPEGSPGEADAVMEHYRSARRISALNDRGEATTDQLRQALGHYRWLFDWLLHPPGRRPAVHPPRSEPYRDRPAWRGHQRP